MYWYVLTSMNLEDGGYNHSMHGEVQSYPGGLDTACLATPFLTANDINEQAP